MIFGAPEAAYIPIERLPIYDKDLFVLESKIINEIVDKHDAVIIGRAGFHVLKGRPNTVHLFVHAPRDYRVERVMKADSSADRREARAKVEEADRRRGKFIRDMAGNEWTDARNYHLCIDSSAAGLTDSVEMVIRFIEKSLSGRET